MSEQFSFSSPTTSAPPGIHPPFPLSRHMAIIFPAFLTVLLPWTLLDSVKRLPVGFPGRELWLSLPGRTQTSLKPPIVLVWYILIHLLIKFPTTSYYYPSSPGFRWIASTPPPSPSSSSQTQPVGRWSFSPSGLPSDPHPLSGTKPKTFLPFWWPILIISAPFFISWVAYISGSIGEPQDRSYKKFSNWVYGVSFACFPFVYYMASDGGALDVGRREL